jgi:hypothetical protein
MKVLLCTITLLCASLSHAVVLNFDYQFDGTSLSLANGTSELLGTSLNVGDTVNLSYSAVGSASYWDFSPIGSSFSTNLGFEYPSSCGTRSSSGAYSAKLNGATLASSSYSVGSQSCIHLGPNYIDFSSVTMLDEFSISYTMNSSSAIHNVIGDYGSSASWQVWDLFDGSLTQFNYQPDAPLNVTEPATFALLVIGVLGLGFARHRQS